MPGLETSQLVDWPCVEAGEFLQGTISVLTSLERAQPEAQILSELQRPACSDLKSIFFCDLEGSESSLKCKCWDLTLDLLTLAVDMGF